MTSVLNVDTIAAKNGTSPVTLTKQHATKALGLMDSGDQPQMVHDNQTSFLDGGNGNTYHNLQ